MKKQVKTREVEEVIEKVNKKSIIEEAKQLLIEQEQKEIDIAAKEFNGFLEKWRIDNDCDITVIGQFEGNQMALQLKVIKLKK